MKRDFWGRQQVIYRLSDRKRNIEIREESETDGVNDKIEEYIRGKNDLQYFYYRKIPQKYFRRSQTTKDIQEQQGPPNKRLDKLQIQH